MRYGSDLPYKSNMVSSIIPEYFNFILDRLVEKNLVKTRPASVTINEYFEGQKISAHIDSKESGQIITVLSLLSETKMIFSKRKEKLNYTVPLPAKSLMQISGEIRDSWEHSTEPAIDLRYSIVFRCAD